MERIIVKPPYTGTLKSYNFVWNIDILWSSSLIVITKGFMLYLMSRVFPQKSLLYFSKLIYNMFWDSWYERLENNFWYRIVLKIKILLYNVRFLFFHIFSTRWMSVTVLQKFFPLLIFHCKKNKYLTFLMYHYLDLYNLNHRLPLEIFSGFQYPQFQNFFSLVLIQKNTKKD